MMILFDNMLSEKYEMLDCKILNENCVQKATFETQIRNLMSKVSLSLFVEQGYYHTGFIPGKIK